MIKDSGERQVFESGATRGKKIGEGRFDLLPWQAIWDVAKHCEEGAVNHGERNVDKGIPMHSFMDSAFRHMTKYMEGHTDEPHLRAAAWNILWAMWTEKHLPEMQDIPARMAVKNNEN